MPAHNTKNNHTTPNPPAPCDNDQCGICEIIINTKAILCNKCNRWIHIKCNKVTIKQYKYYQENPEATFECKNCNMCGVCNKIVAKNHHAIECNTCLKWIHIKCNKFSDKEYKSFQENSDMHFFCINCMADSLPLLTLNDNQFELTANGIDYSNEIDPIQIFLSQSLLETIDRFNNAIYNITFNLDEDKTETESENSVPSIDCKYYYR